jgi:uncharacterized damage-inducible protein DinB
MINAAENRITSLLADRLEQSSRKLVDLAEAIPADNFDKAPLIGVRTCAEVLRHVAFWNDYVAGTLRGKKVDDSANELPANEYASKEKILEAVRRSADAVTSAVNDQASETVLPFLEHSCEHYGQLVVYARLLGITPPASRT